MGDEGLDGRRRFLRTTSSLFMLSGVVCGYGACAGMAGRYLFPPRPRELRWLYVARVADVARGAALAFRTPAGERVNVARQGEGSSAADFVALSSVCPHLGCQVHWEAPRSRFFCPCHNGVFSPEGEPLAGPPAEAGQALVRYPLRVEDGLLFVQAPVDALPGPEPA